MATTKVVRFESIDAFIADIRAKETRVGMSNWGGYCDPDSATTGDWDGGVSPNEAMKRAVQGDTSIVAASTDALDKLEIQQGEEIAWTTVRDVWGTRPDIGAFLAGSPYNMKRRVRANASTRHVSIYVSTTCSAGISASDMLKRGQTILGLLEALQQMQVGVDLYLLVESGGREGKINSIGAIRIESRPLDISTAGFAIAHPAFARHLTYTHWRTLDGGWNGSWPVDYHYGDYTRILRGALEMSDSDIWIPAATTYDDAMRNPATFIQEKIQQVIK